MPSLVSTIYTQVASILNDTDHTRYPTELLLPWVTAAQIAVVTKKPTANSNVAEMPLAAGHRQGLPSGALAMIDVTRNIAGGTILEFEHETFRILLPSWEDETPTDVCQFFMRDSANPKRFHVFPPSNGQVVEVVYGAIPDPPGVSLSLDEEFDEAIVYYVVFRAKQLDTAEGSRATAAVYFGLFLQSLGIKAPGVQRVEQETPPEQ